MGTYTARMHFWTCVILFLCPVLAQNVTCDCSRYPTLQQNLQNTCFATTQNQPPTTICTQLRVRVIDQALSYCASSLVGSNFTPCNGIWVTIDQFDVSTYDVYACNFTTLLGSLLNTNCNPSTIVSSVYLIGPIQIPQPGFQIPTGFSLSYPLFNTSTRCLTPICPGIPTNLTGIAVLDRLITPYAGGYLSVCDIVYQPANLCVNNQCMCATLLNGQTSFTGNACQFEKGAYCCSTQNHQITPPPFSCCPNQGAVLEGQCSTAANQLMCGVLGLSNSARCNSLTGTSQPFCTTCPSGLNGTVCQNSACAPNCVACNFGDMNPACCFNQDCTVNPSSPHGMCALGSNGQPQCQCFVSPDITQPLYLGNKCQVQVSGCRSPFTCDTTQPVIPGVPHPCVCSGAGICILSGPLMGTCDCVSLNSTGQYVPNFMEPATQCSTLDACQHCNTMGSTCTQELPEDPAFFQCNCLPTWQTKRISSCTVCPFNCNWATCVGTLNVPGYPVDGTIEAARVLPNGQCSCPYNNNITVYFNDTVNNNFGCQVMGQPGPAGSWCGLGQYVPGVVQPLFLPTVTLASNQQPFMVPYTNFTGFATCNCDSFQNASWPLYSWILSAPTNSCEPFCPPLVNFQTYALNGQQLRFCTNCEAFGYVTNPVTHRCTNTQVCVAPGSVWNATALRCACLIYPYDYDFPTDPLCTQTRCYPFGTFNNLTNTCVCPIIVSTPAPIPPLTPPPTHPANEPGCISNCVANQGTLTPTFPGAVCTCNNGLFSGVLCDTNLCVNGVISYLPNGTAICGCTNPVYGGKFCTTILCDPHKTILPLPTPVPTQCPCVSALLQRNTLCTLDFCTAYMTGTNIIAYNPASGGTAVFNSLTSVWFCQCGLGWQVSNIVIPISGTNVPTLMQTCNVRLCPADQNIIPAGTGFVCRCMCPNLLAQMSFPPGTQLSPECSNSTCVHPSQASLNNPQCKGYVAVNTTQGWLCQCDPAWSGSQCNTFNCVVGKSTWNYNTGACQCTGTWGGAAPACSTCLLTGIPPGTLNTTSCKCVGTAGPVKQVGSTCVLANTTCPDPNGYGCPGTTAGIGSNLPPTTTSGMSTGTIIVVTLGAILGAVLVGVTIWAIYVAVKVREHDRAEEGGGGGNDEDDEERSVAKEVRVKKPGPAAKGASGPRAVNGKAKVSKPASRVDVSGKVPQKLAKPKSHEAQPLISHNRRVN